MNGMALCAGAGGLELGLHLALGDAYRTVVGVEWEASAASVLVALTRNDGKSRMDILDNQAIYFLPSLPAPETVTHGSESSPSAPTSRRRSLNPRFVEWLMAFPPGWTSLAPLGSDSRATPSSPHVPHAPFAPSGRN